MPGGMSIHHRRVASLRVVQASAEGKKLSVDELLVEADKVYAWICNGTHADGSRPALDPAHQRRR